MSHRQDKERAKNGLVFRDGNLLQKPEEPPEVTPEENEVTPEEDLPPTEYEDYFNPGDYCVLPKHGTEYCQERYCHGCPKHLDYKGSLGSAHHSTVRMTVMGGHHPEENLGGIPNGHLSNAKEE